MRLAIMKGDARDLPLPDSSVDLVITSPPYWEMRSYQDGGVSYEGQIGREGSLEAYLDSLLEVTREMVRVLKPHGSIWVNLGDKYRKRSLTLMPQRYAIRCADELGLHVRAEMIWSKPNAYVDARAADRVRHTHETWWHLAPSRTPFGTDALRVSNANDYAQRPQYQRAQQLFEEAGLTDDHRAAVRAVGIIDSEGGQVRSGGSWTSRAGQLALEVQRALGSYYRELCGSGASGPGRMPGSVWEVAAYPFKPPRELALEKHFATFPIDIPARLVAGWSEPGMTVLDPMGGSGAVALAASVAGRYGISVDMSSDYCRLAEWRVSDPREIAKATAATPTTRPGDVRGTDHAKETGDE